MELKISRVMEQGEDDKLQPVLELVLKADDDEKEVFISLGLDKLNDSDELFQKYFGYHRDLYSALEIDSKYWDRLHGSDNQFSGTCKGFALFLTRISEQQLDKVSEVLLGKIREELQRTNHTLTSVRTIMLSPTKRLPKTTFPLEDNTMRLQQGNKVYNISMQLVNEESDIIDCIRGTAKETIETYQEFYQDSSQQLLQTVESEYREEVQRTKERYKNRALFPEWLTEDIIRDMGILCYNAGHDQISFVLPFRYNLTMVKSSRAIFNLRPDYQEHRNIKLIATLQNQRFVWARMVENNLSPAPNFHTVDDQLCLGSFNYPEHDIEAIGQLMSIRDDIQGIMMTANFDSLGTSGTYSDLMNRIANSVNEGDINQVVDDTPAYVHRS